MGDSIAHNFFYSTVFVFVVSTELELSQKHVLLFVTYHPVACFLFSGCCWLCNCVGDIFLERCLSILADHVHALKTSFQQNNGACHKVKKNTNQITAFLNMTMS